MTETVMLTDHQAIRDWAEARIGSPAIIDAQASIGATQPVLRLLFDQHAYQDQDQGADRPSAPRLVDWDEWFQMFEEHELALVVAQDVDGRRENFHEIIRR
ncbi:hypothetical protein [Limoniibacter endophyticus]|nr:hypothetical protein [Limoniibacter endophyticus]